MSSKCYISPPVFSSGLLSILAYVIKLHTIPGFLGDVSELLFSLQVCGEAFSARFVSSSIGAAFSGFYLPSCSRFSYVIDWILLLKRVSSRWLGLGMLGWVL